MGEDGRLAGPTAVVALADVADRVRAAPPRLGGTRLVLVDGPSGSGKTVLAGRLAAALGQCPVLHMDDLYPGWDGLASAVPLLLHVLAPLAEGRAGTYRRYDWEAGDYAEEHAVPPGGPLVVEGVGSGARAAADSAVLLVWVQAPREERFRRGIERDGRGYLGHWQRWAVQEDELFAREGTARRAALVVDGAPAEPPPDPDRQVVVVSGTPPPG